MQFIVKEIDGFLNGITMYRLVLYGLCVMATFAIVCGFTGLISYGGFTLIVSLAIAFIASFLVNEIFARIYGAPTNSESAAISALILFLILYPAETLHDAGIIALTCSIAMASKYLLSYRQRHIFNPAAIALVIIGIAGSYGSIWWIGSAIMLPITVIVGLLIVRKIRRFALFSAFILASVVTIVIDSFFADMSIHELLAQSFISWPLVFFASIMLTEPYTVPPRKKQQIAYGVIVGVISSVPYHIGPIYGTPELALIIGNLYAYALSLRERVLLTLKEKRLIARDTYEFVFTVPHKITFLSGQYLEWMLPHEKPDTRGVRRYFTIASSPEEDTVRLGVKMPEKPSTYKRALLALSPGGTMRATQLGGDFILPDLKETKLVFIAGGIGITPFRSMIKHCLDRNETRPIHLFYANKAPQDIAYGELFAEAERRFGLKVTHVIDNKDTAPADFVCETGFIDRVMIERYVPDYRERTFYISGPNAMVDAYKKLLTGMGVSRKKIVTDYFPGFA